MTTTPLSLQAPPSRLAEADSLTTPREMMDVIRTMIENSIITAPRSLQKTIGPSELGTPCDHCLAAKLAGWETRQDPAWLPFIGTCVHEHLERFFATQSTNHVLESMQEARVTVGEVGGQSITGSTDLYLPHAGGDGSPGMTVDWKIVGTSTLNRVRAAQHPGPQYEAQAHLYAKGWNDAGYKTGWVCVFFMPRTKFRLSDGYVWIDVYRPDIAASTLDRANQIASTLAVLEQVSTQARDTWITGLPRDPHCFACNKYKDSPTLDEAITGKH